MKSYKSFKLRISKWIRVFIIVTTLGQICTGVIISRPEVIVKSFGIDLPARKFYASEVDKDNTVWFLTEAGIVSFDGTKWAVYNNNRKITTINLRDMVCDTSSYGKELWIATSQGATVASVPIDARSGATTYYPDNSKILSENVLAVATGKKELRWFGTDKGISAFKNKAWLTNSYTRKYPEAIFQDYPITSMDTSPDGDSLYAGTRGGGVVRVFRNEVDAVTGASEYAAWGPIHMPSDTVNCVHISGDGVQWFGTDKGVAKHTGYITLEAWTVFTTAEGLADNYVQDISSDAKGNIYFGTKKGLSVFDGTKWITYRMEDGLAGNNILTVAVDRKENIWIGTDNGVCSLYNGKITIYR